jgi:Tfp pilus assembly protein PilF
MRRVVFILTVLIGAIMAVMPAVIDPVRAAISPADEATLREASDLLNHKQPAESLAKLAPLRPTLAGDTNFDLVYGIALLETGKPRQAEVAFRRVLAVQPENLLARAHLARALAADGELDDARREIMVLRDRPDLPPDVRVVMDNNLQQIDEARKQRAQAKAAVQAQAKAVTQAAGKPVSEQDAARIRAAAELVRAEKSAEAYDQLAPMEARLAGNPDFDYVYGIAALDAGHPAQAVVALRRALSVRPDFYTARAELGRALAAMGDLAGAKREFETVRNVPDLPPIARDAMGRQVTAIDQVVANQSAKRYSGYLESSIGYDTNVNAGPADQALFIPGLGVSTTVSPQSMPKKSGFYELAGGFSGVLPIDNETVAFTNLAGDFHPLFDYNSEFGNAQAGGEAGVARQVPNVGILSVAGVAQTFLLGGQMFRNIFGAAAQWRKPWTDIWDTSVAVSWLRLDYPTVDCPAPEPSGCQNSNRFTLTGTVAGRFDTPMKPVVFLTVNVGKELTIDSAEDFFSFGLLGVRAGFEFSPRAWMTFFMQGGYEYDRYDADFPLFFYPRRDQIIDALGGVEFKLSDAWSVRTSLRWYDTLSNVNLYTYQRLIAQTAVRWTF